MLVLYDTCWFLLLSGPAPSHNELISASPRIQIQSEILIVAIAGKSLLIHGDLRIHHRVQLELGDV